MKLRHIITFIFLLLLVAGMGITSDHLKEKPQLYMLVFIAIAGMLAIKNEEKIFTGFFYVLLALMFYVSVFNLCNWIMHLTDPDEGDVMVHGHRERVMNMNWIWSLLLGSVLTPFFLWAYHKSSLRNFTVEYSITGILFISTLVLYIVNELM